MKNKLPLFIVYFIAGITGAFACFLLDQLWGILFLIFFVCGGIILLKNKR